MLTDDFIMSLYFSGYSVKHIIDRCMAYIELYSYVEHWPLAAVRRHVEDTILKCCAQPYRKGRPSLIAQPSAVEN